MEWNDLKYLLAVARHETLIGAAKSLAVDQTTVGRRIQALEKSLGSRLFDRVDRRWLPTVAGHTALELAARIDEQINAASASISGQDQSLAGTVRLTSVPMIVNHVLAPVAGQFAKSYPEMSLELHATAQTLDLRQLQADIALRLSRPTDPSAVIRKVASIGFQVVCARRFARRAAQLPWVAFDPSLARLPEARWLDKQCRQQKPMLRVSSIEAMTQVVLSSPCRALLPAVLIRRQSGLLALGGPEAVVSRDLWMVYMKDLRNNARVQAAARWAVQACQATGW